MPWFGRRKREQELDEEIAAHFALEVKRRIEAGQTAEEAESAARRAFGSVALVQEVTRSMWGMAWVESVAQDLRFALRTMRAAPGFTVVAILTLALGIGANTAIFSVVDAALFRPLPFPDSDRLVRVQAVRAGVPLGGPSVPDGRDFDRAAQSFEGIVVFDHWRKNVSGILGSSEPAEMVVGLVPGKYFDLLRVRPVMGRVFTEQESEYGRHFVAIVSERFWRQRLAADPGVVGHTLRINGETYTIVGVVPEVVPAWMDGTTVPISIWTPFASPDMATENARGGRGNSSIGRLKPGVTLEQASAELATLAARLAREHPIDQGIGTMIEPLADTRSGPVRPVLLMLSAAVGMVLLISCANLASLMLARNSARYREMAVRAALGAGRGRLVRQLLLESVSLALCGGIAGLVLIWAAGFVLTRTSAAPATPYLSASTALSAFWSAAPQPRVFLFTLGISVLTAVLFGLAPAFSGSRVSLADTLREGGRSGSVGAARQRFRRVLVTAEVALSLVLVIAAALLVKTMIRLQRRDPGFRTDHLLVAHLFIPPARYESSETLSRFCAAFSERMRGIPGVLDAGVTTGFPPLIGWQQMFMVPGTPAARLEDVPKARYLGVDERYLGTLGLVLRSGRNFQLSDTADSPPVILVNEEFVRRFFPNRNPIGLQIRPGPPAGIPARPLQDFGGSRREMTIVGVVRNFMNDGLVLPPAPQIFALFRQLPGINFGFKDIVVRTTGEPESVAPAIARELRALDADIPLGEVRTMEAHFSAQTSDTRFTTVLLGFFAALGTILAVIGAYGVVAYLVAQRTQEIGVRVALGASSSDVLYLVLRYGLSIGVAGVALGVAGAMVVRQFLTRLLYGVSSSDPATFVGAPLLLLAVILAASAIPARRALRIDPVKALRAE